MSLNEELFKEEFAEYGSNQAWTIEIDGKMIKCSAKRGFCNSWCGYVEITNEQINQLDIDEINVHGGVSYAYDKIGFDCAHCDDYVPYYIYNDQNTKYWTFPEVQKETEFMARQIYEQLKKKDLY